MRVSLACKGHEYQPTPLKEKEHFGGLSTGGLAVPTRYYVRDVDFSSVDVQKSLEEVGAEILTLNGINQERIWIIFFAKRFRLWSILTRIAHIQYMSYIYIYIYIYIIYWYNYTVLQLSSWHCSHAFPRTEASKAGTLSSRFGPTRTRVPWHLCRTMLLWLWIPAVQDARQVYQMGSPLVPAISWLEAHLPLRFRSFWLPELEVNLMIMSSSLTGQSRWHVWVPFMWTPSTVISKSMHWKRPKRWRKRGKADCRAASWTHRSGLCSLRHFRRMRRCICERSDHAGNFNQSFSLFFSSPPGPCRSTSSLTSTESLYPKWLAVSGFVWELLRWSVH